VLEQLPAPGCSFASDNSAAVHPAVLDALAAANSGHVLAYGEDRYTEAAYRQFAAVFGRDVPVFFVWGGSGANVMALASLWRPGGSVICTDAAHINVDETASPERVVGAKLVDLPAPDSKLTADLVEAQLGVLGNPHHAQPVAVSITQSTESGTLYQPDEVAAIAKVAHAHGLKVHIDGARIANAVAALGGTTAALRSFTVDAGVDVISFGGTKNGMMYGEAVVYLDESLAASAPFVRKQVGQLPSKMRYVAAQFSALLQDGLWIANAGNANRMAQRLFDHLGSEESLRLAPPAVNSLFPTLAAPAVDELRAWCPFYDWDPAASTVRWMTAWDTTASDVDRFAAGVRAVLDIASTESPARHA
jgi:threonine aldolase